MKVDALLRRKGNVVVTIRPDQLVRQAVGELTGRNIGALVVSFDGRTVEGIVSDAILSPTFTGPGRRFLICPSWRSWSARCRPAAPQTRWRRSWG